MRRGRRASSAACSGSKRLARPLAAANGQNARPLAATRILDARHPWFARATRGARHAGPLFYVWGMVRPPHVPPHHTARLSERTRSPLSRKARCPARHALERGATFSESQGSFLSAARRPLNRKARSSARRNTRSCIFWSILQVNSRFLAIISAWCLAARPQNDPQPFGRPIVLAKRPLSPRLLHQASHVDGNNGHNARIGRKLWSKTPMRAANPRDRQGEWDKCPVSLCPRSHRTGAFS